MLMLLSLNWCRYAYLSVYPSYGIAVSVVYCLRQSKNLLIMQVWLFNFYCPVPTVDKLISITYPTVNFNVYWYLLVSATYLWNFP